MLKGKGALSDVVIDGDESVKAMNYITEMGITFNKKEKKLTSLFDIPE